MTTKIQHPAKYTDTLMPTFAKYLAGKKRILDPFAGSGKIFSLESKLPGSTIFGLEIEEEWKEMHQRTQLGNALAMPWPADYFDAICTSPCYGNRMADSHTPSDRDKSRVRNTYTHTLGRKLHQDNAGQLQWGAAYQEFHVKVWQEAVRVLGLAEVNTFILNCKDFLKTKAIPKKGLPPFESVYSHDESTGKSVVQIHVTDWHVMALNGLGFNEVARHSINTPGQRNGANGGVRIGFEEVVVMELRK